jgi:hypothetical protein
MRRSGAICPPVGGIVDLLVITAGWDVLVIEAKGNIAVRTGRARAFCGLFFLPAVRKGAVGINGISSYGF